MKRISILAIALVFIGAIVLWLSQDASPSPRGLTVQFLGFTNDAKLGASALICITNGTSQQHVLSGLMAEIKVSDGWVARAVPTGWELVNARGKFLERFWGMIILPPNTGLIVKIPPPHGLRVAPGVWRVRFNSGDWQRPLVMKLSNVTRGASDRFFGFLSRMTRGASDWVFGPRTVPIFSPEIHY